MSILPLPSQSDHRHTSILQPELNSPYVAARRQRDIEIPCRLPGSPLRVSYDINANLFALEQGTKA
jgi:hypothetical protein